MIEVDFIVEARSLDGDPEVWNRVRSLLTQVVGVERVEITNTPRGAKLTICSNFSDKKTGQRLLKSFMRELKSEKSISLGSLQYDLSKLYD